MAVPADKGEQQVHITIPSHYRNIARVREFISGVVQTVPVGEDGAYDLVLATVEAVTNAIRHAGAKQVRLEVATNSDRIAVRIIDRGHGFAFYPEKCDFPCLEELGGRGLPLMYNLMDELTVKSEPGRGTEVTLIKKFTGVNNHSQSKAGVANA